MKLFIKISLSITILTAIGCTTPAVTNSGNADISGTKVLFKDVKTIIDAKCVTCHNASRAEDGFMLDTDSKILSASNKINREVISGKMPPRNSGYIMSETEKNTIRDWVAQGSSSN